MFLSVGCVVELMLGNEIGMIALEINRSNRETQISTDGEKLRQQNCARAHLCAVQRMKALRLICSQRSTAGKTVWRKRERTGTLGRQSDMGRTRVCRWKSHVEQHTDGRREHGNEAEDYHLDFVRESQYYKLSSRHKCHLIRRFCILRTTGDTYSV